MPALTETKPRTRGKVIQEPRVLFVRMEKELHQELTERAGAEGTTIAKYVRELLQDALQSTAA